MSSRGSTKSRRRKLPQRLKWVFWDVDFARLDVERDASSIMARALELGRMEDVRVLMRIYAEEQRLAFFREGAHPLVSERTRSFWEAYFGVENGQWPRPPACRQSNAAPWID